MVLYAKDIMQKYALTVSEDLTAYEGAKIMQENNVGFLIVQENEMPIGIVTEWDYIHSIIVNRMNPDEVKLKELMRTDIVTVTPDTPTDKVAYMMNQKRVRRVPVIENGKLVGVITSRDILRIFKEYMDKLSQIIAGFRSY